MVIERRNFVRTPDLDLIKQVKQVSSGDAGRRARGAGRLVPRGAGFSNPAASFAGISLYFEELKSSDKPTVDLSKARTADSHRRTRQTV